MAEVKQAVIKHLMNNALVFAAFGNRIWADKLQDNPTYPCARIWVVASAQSYHMAGENGRKPLVQIDIYDDDIAGADINAELIRQALSGYKGMLGDVDAGYVFVNNVAGSWNEEARKEHRILEVEIGTNS